MRAVGSFLFPGRAPQGRGLSHVMQMTLCSPGPSPGDMATRRTEMSVTAAISVGCWCIQEQEVSVTAMEVLI